jgi:hypothetical protein
MNLKGKHPRKRLRSKWEQQVRTAVPQKERWPGEEAKEQELWKNRDRFRGLVVRLPTQSGNILGRRRKRRRR